MSEVFSGVGVALVTVFDARGEVDRAATSGLASNLAARGMNAVIVSGTTGEARTLAPGERVALVEAVRAALPSAVPVIAGTGASTARAAAELTKAAVNAGASAVLAWPPPGSTEHARYYETVVEAADGCPVLAYHFPAVSSPGVPVPALATLPVAGVKDSSGSADRLLDELTHYGGATYVGSSALLALAGPMGAAGAILALANIEPERCCRAFAGDVVAQRELADRHLEVHRGGPAALKRILAADWGLSPVARVA
ncbi:MAG: dihydrodipicolinate synthase family protein [Kitasatospora sp.]|jgi:dihydrodipicolinate synthase/N-acetylneuraminate lyase|nr:dihydrodipicolinate synthase family protein [Kitasatospora sp.]